MHPSKIWKICYYWKRQINILDFLADVAMYSKLVQEHFGEQFGKVQ